MKKQIEPERAIPFVDFHSHVLPSIDDGSPDVNTSIEMLRMMAAQGVKKVIATPHFDATQTSPKEFIEKRNVSEQILRNAIEESGEEDDLPRLYVGAEVLYYPGISHSESIKELCLANTKLLLLEMPFFVWGGTTVDEILEMKGNLNVSPVLAHLDRYFLLQKKAVLDDIVNSDLLIQINADAFLEARTSKKALKMLDKGRIDFVGSDCHNLSSRAPNFDKLMEFITKKKRNDAMCDVFNFGNEILID